MNLLLDSLNFWGSRALDFAWPMLWQSSLLIGLVFVLEGLLRRRVRAAVRYALWLAVLLKLLLPPSLALPTSLGWWLQPATPMAAHTSTVAVKEPFQPVVTEAAPRPLPGQPAARRPLSIGALALMCSAGMSLALVGWLLLRWRQVRVDARRAGCASDWQQELLNETARGLGLRRHIPLKLLDQPISPALCGLIHPVILLPRSLAESLSRPQLRAVLLHELMHLRRADVWFNYAQALLQIFYWWHPLLWLANARIRRVREEAVDDAVMLALQGEAEVYAPTLLKVARLALQRPLSSLGLVGILESPGSLRQRIERLLVLPPPRHGGLTLGSVLCVVAFGALALPMGGEPAANTPTNRSAKAAAKESRSAHEQFLNLQAQCVLVHASALQALYPSLATPGKPVVLSSNELSSLDNLRSSARCAMLEGKDTPAYEIWNNGLYTWRLDSHAHTAVNYQTEGSGKHTMVTGADIAWATGVPELEPVSFCIVPRQDAQIIRCEGNIFTGLSSNRVEVGAAAIPPMGALLCAAPAQGAAAEQWVLILRRTAPPYQLDLNIRFMEVWDADVAAFQKAFLPSGAAPGSKPVLLTPMEATALFEKLHKLKKAKLLNEARLTTLGERQCMVEVIDMKSINTAINPAALTPPGVKSAPDASASPHKKGQISETLTNGPLVLQTRSFGPTVDINPRVQNDGQTIQMKVIPSLNEFLGYDKSTSSVTVYVDGKKTEMAPPLPRFRVRCSTNTFELKDGQTAVLDNLEGSEISTLASGQTTGTPSVCPTNRLLVFVTARIIDSAGKPIHAPAKEGAVEKH